MQRAFQNYWSNLGKMIRGKRILHPLVATYYLTTQCNLNCAYCEDFGARKNGANFPPLALGDALKILRVIRSGTDSLILTGGEPLLHPDIDDLVKRARTEIGFRSLTILTNGSLLDGHEALLRYIDRLVISLDTVDLDLWSSIINVPASTTNRIYDNIQKFAKLQQRYKFRMALNCVLTPQTLPRAKDLLDFCKQEGLLLAFSPQAVMNWPSYDLLVSQEYKAFLSFIVEEKKRGGPVLGSHAYLRTLLDFHPYACYPTLNPRILPAGELIYPCRPIEKDNRGHGGKTVNLREVNTWDEAMDSALDEYGNPPVVCTSCFQQCFAEPSLMQSRPFSWLSEWVRYPSSRNFHLPTFAPG